MSVGSGMMAETVRGDVMVVHGVTMLTREQATARRAALVKQLGMTERELVRRAEDFQLTSEEAAVYDEIEDLGYLLRTER